MSELTSTPVTPTKRDSLLILPAGIRATLTVYMIGKNAMVPIVFSPLKNLDSIFLGTHFTPEVIMSIHLTRDELSAHREYNPDGFRPMTEVEIKDWEAAQ